MSKIKFTLVPLEKALAFQITDMDKRFKNCTYTACNNFKVVSMNAPHIDTCTSCIYIRGQVTERDLDVVSVYFDSNVARDAFKDKMVEALKDWANNWEGWLAKKESLLKTYEF